MIEVFKTDIRQALEASRVSEVLKSTDPASSIAFDLEDCDHVLRVESINVDQVNIIRQVESLGFKCSVLTD